MDRKFDCAAPLPMAVLAELSLAGLGVVVCLLAGLPVADLLASSGSWQRSLAWGVAATAPMVGVLWGVLAIRWKPLTRLRDLAGRLIVGLLGRAGLPGIALVAAAAGLGEEVLFRGALQPLFAGWLGDWPAVVVAGVLFGLAHPMSASYVVVATVCGLYLGALTQISGELLPAIIAHALYDFVAIVWLLRISR